VTCYRGKRRADWVDSLDVQHALRSWESNSDGDDTRFDIGGYQSDYGARAGLGWGDSGGPQRSNYRYGGNDPDGILHDIDTQFGMFPGGGYLDVSGGGD
jgi:hypothetical protein